MLLYLAPVGIAYAFALWFLWSLIGLLFHLLLIGLFTLAAAIPLYLIAWWITRGMPRLPVRATWRSIRTAVRDQLDQAADEAKRQADVSQHVETFGTDLEGQSLAGKETLLEKLSVEQASG